MSPKVSDPVDVFDELDGIKKQKLASDLPDEFIAEVVEVVRDVKKGEYSGAPILKLTIRTEDGEETITTFRIPKAWTGKGQMDMLKATLEELDLTIRNIKGKKFRWKRMPLPGSLKGHDRHYPVEVIK